MRPSRVALIVLCAALAHAHAATAQADAAPFAPETTGGERDVDAAPERGQGGPAGDAAIARALHRYDAEPGVERVVQAALAAAPPGRAQALASRARTAGFIPRIGLHARRGQTIDLSSDGTVDTAALRLKSNDDLTLEATLQFELDRVVFRREEVPLARQERAERAARRQMVREVIHLYFERRRLQLERDLRRDENPERAMRIAEIEALLDVFTNGEFRRMIAESQWKTGASTPATTSQSPPKSKPPAAPSPAKPVTSRPAASP